MDGLAEQQEYYRQRAPEYDEWWQSRGRHTRTPDAQRAWLADITEVERALDAFAPTGDVLELAAGTGWWTERLVRYTDRVTAVDAAEEVLALNRRRIGSDTVTYRQLDLFAWSPPPTAYDVVFFGFWLSHVPADRLAAFWSLVTTALRPGGRVFLVDSYHAERLPGDLQPRELNDGRRFEVVKRFWQPAELTTDAAAHGLGLTAHVTGYRSMIWAAGGR